MHKTNRGLTATAVPNISTCLVNEGKRMYAREWKCTCPLVQKAGFIQYLYETGVKETAATAGFRGAQIFERELENVVEITLITYWETLESIHAFAGEDISVAKLYPDDAQYQIVPDTEVKHYHVIEHFFRNANQAATI
jgi:hypothetical protein